MSCTQSNIFIPTARLVTPARRLSRTCSLSQVSFVHVSALCTSLEMPMLVCSSPKYKTHSPICLFGGKGSSRDKNKVSFVHASALCTTLEMPGLVCSSPKYKTHGPICLFGGKGSSRGENKAFPWDPLKDFVRSWSQERTVQDTLREQIGKREFGDDGDGGGGNRAGNGGDGSGGTEDEGFSGILDETLQVILATLGFIFVYIYIIRGAELTKLARDYIKYLFGGVPSMRLKRTMDRWRRFYDKFSWTEDSEDWLERKILTTPTWWHRPKALARVIRSKLRDYEQK